MHPKLSIITVTYNAESFIERTLGSISNQSYDNIESIIVDGLSKDKTLELVNQFKIQNSIVVSEKDKGLYDAMNKGIDMAQGEYICFMNAGDVFYSNNTLSQVFASSHGEDFIYGDTIILDENGDLKPYHKQKPDEKSISYRSFINGMVICHQSMIIKKSCAEKYDFSHYRLACDIDWTIRSLRNCKSFKDSGIFISKFLEGGVSQSNRGKAVKERFWICVHQFGWIPTIFQNIKMVLAHFYKKIN